MEIRLFGELLKIIRRLRGEDGCPWDRAQTIESLKPFLIEECYEVIEAIEEGNPDKIQEELGDLLFQIIFLAQIGQEQGNFDIAQILTTVSQKMVRRHPHVFSDGTAKNASEVLEKWEEIKRTEEAKGNKSGNSSVLDGIPKGLPSMTYAHRVQEKVSRVGFDWTRLEDVMEKLDEEIVEFREALVDGDKEKCRSEFGDLFFTMINISRFLRFDPEGALRNATKRFIERFKIMESTILKRGQTLKEIDLSELDILWEQAKSKVS
ncbi:MAG: nucleoside triphosphate pyrophosphohydrolase [bacterium]